jgi:hypothetical protein
VELLDRCYPNPTIKLSEIQSFFNNTAQATFLFGSDIQDHLKEIRDHAVSLENLSSELSTAMEGVSGRDRIDIIEERRAEVKWLRVPYDEAVLEFMDCSRL